MQYDANSKKDTSTSHSSLMELFLCCCCFVLVDFFFCSFSACACVRRGGGLPFTDRSYCFFAFSSSSPISPTFFTWSIEWEVEQRPFILGAATRGWFLHRRPFFPLRILFRFHSGFGLITLRRVPLLRELSFFCRRKRAHVEAGRGHPRKMC